jgi:hypothetical protein
MGSDATEGADIFKGLAAETMVEEVAIDVGLEMGTRAPNVTVLPQPCSAAWVMP